MTAGGVASPINVVAVGSYIALTDIQSGSLLVCELVQKLSSFSPYVF